MPGPSASCERYDNTAVLTENDINEIVNRINDRRNFIALGLSKLLPQAANMKKILWSEELATFAQRWVDQCDQSLRPDKEDQCRDLVEENVGQNIASILDPSPNFNVKSFVDIWSMPTLDYFGSVSYYNQSRNHKTYYFTQLIWADSDMVGCGRARFFHHKQNTMIERLVCNFTPKGNIHGKPIYNIGYPATQCPIYTRPDRNYKGLCKRYLQENVTKLTPSSPHPRVNSLLRIINLSNNSVKQEINPIRNDWKHLKSNVNKSIEQRHQKTRHVLNNTHESMKHVSYNNRKNNINHSRSSYINTYSQARGHSRLYHGYDMHNNVYTLSHQENFKKFSYSTEVFNPYLNQNYKKHNQNPCTRKNMYPENYSSTCETVSDKCTRQYENNDYLQSTKSYGPSTDIYYAIKKPITIKIKDNINIRINSQNSLTEKYLSFDELMHLRKLGITDVENNARRKANDALRNTNISTTEVTANTPFLRKKHCTRKLTCTWTASSPTGADGSVIPGGNIIDRGSRTPPGYVDGCTRTSTCTRDFMDRNKMATVGEESSGEPDPENEDYCERKSLNIHKRKSGLKRYAPISSKHTESR
ncbi:uncharacterized protein LOC113515635 [Galleria mellonella]|uniref:Uncharacterized protein LOC113515635 n=1 Tax=Galleria mellonella TaxID=7137 RepID=A0ABM3MD48_GALME|nr:uncharacterized protein LOC113515635 [Galleria mellonella]